MRNIALLIIVFALPSFAFAGVDCEQRPDHPKCQPSQPSPPSTPQYIVRDGNGDIIGPAYSPGHRNASVRLVYTDTSGVDHGYALTFGPNSDLDAPSAIGQSAIYWDNGACAGNPVYASAAVEQSYLEPFHDKDYFVLRTTKLGDIRQLGRITGPAQSCEMFFWTGASCSPTSNQMVPIEVVIEDLQAPAVYPELL